MIILSPRPRPCSLSVEIHLLRNEKNELRSRIRLQIVSNSARHPPGEEFGNGRLHAYRLFRNQNGIPAKTASLSRLFCQARRRRSRRQQCINLSFNFFLLARRALLFLSRAVSFEAAFSPAAKKAKSSSSSSSLDISTHFLSLLSVVNNIRNWGKRGECRWVNGEKRKKKKKKKKKSESMDYKQSVWQVLCQQNIYAFIHTRISPHLAWGATVEKVSRRFTAVAAAATAAAVAGR